MSLLNGDISEYQETMANETNIEQMFITLQPFNNSLRIERKKSEDRDPLLSLQTNKSASIKTFIANIKYLFEKKVWTSESSIIGSTVKNLKMQLSLKNLNSVVFSIFTDFCITARSILYFEMIFFGFIKKKFNSDFHIVYN